MAPNSQALPGTLGHCWAPAGASVVFTYDVYQKEKPISMQKGVDIRKKKQPTNRNSLTRIAVWSQ